MPSSEHTARYFNAEPSATDACFEFARNLLEENAYGNVSTEEFIEEAKTASGFGGAQLDLLDEFFQQWLYGEVKPTILAEDF